MPNEFTRLRDEGLELKEEGQDYIGSYICCRKLATVRFSCLERRRHQVFYMSHVASAIGVVLTILAVVGAYSYGDTLSYLSWVQVHTPQGEAHGGVLYLCWDTAIADQGEKSNAGQGEKTNAQMGGVTVDPKHTHGYRPGSLVQFGEPAGTKLENKVVESEMGYWGAPSKFSVGNWDCSTWQDFKCGTTPCKACKYSSLGLTFSAFIGLFSYIAFYKHCDERLLGKDSNFVKFVTVASAIIGGSNFLCSVFGYWNSCVIVANSLEDSVVRAGWGLWCITAAAVLKVLMGFLHLGLPVEKSIKNVDI